MHFQKGADEQMFRRLRLRAKIQMAQTISLRSQKRLQRNLHGLVPLPILLRMQVQSYLAINTVRVHQRMSFSQPQIFVRSRRNVQSRSESFPDDTVHC